MRSSSHKHKFAKLLRKSLSPPETRLWVRLRVRVPGRPSFRRQHPIGPYVADFYCSQARLVVEVDGAQHAEADHEAYDINRDRYLKDRGYRVMRIWAADVMADPDGTAEWIVDQAIILSERG